MIVVGIGSNVGDRLATMRSAVVRLPNVTRLSRVYETDPVGGVVQPPFLNAAALLDWGDDPVALLARLQTIEAELGRDRTREVRWGPRTLDLDILWIDDGTRVDHPRLVVPHPRLSERAFAVLPLLDVAPTAPFAVPDAAGVRVTDLTLTES